MCVTGNNLVLHKAMLEDASTVTAKSAQMSNKQLRQKCIDLVKHHI